MNFLLIKLRLPYLNQTRKNRIPTLRNSNYIQKALSATTLANTSDIISLSHQSVWGRLFQPEGGKSFNNPVRKPVHTIIIHTQNSCSFTTTRGLSCICPIDNSSPATNRPTN